MTLYEWDKFISRLNLSSRTHNLLIRAYQKPNEFEMKYPTGKNKMVVWLAFREVVSYKDLKEAIETVHKKIERFGIRSYNEVMEELNKAEEAEKTKVWHLIKDGLPALGVPLSVECYDSVNNKLSVKYPVYYIKDPYDLSYKWVFFPAMERLCVLLPEYSEVKKWKYIERSDTE